MIMSILWPQSPEHYWIGVAIWLAIGITASVVVLRRRGNQLGREDAILGAAFFTTCVAFTWPIEQFLVYAIVAFLIIAFAITAATRDGDS